MKLTLRISLIYELRKEEMIDKILHEYCSQIEFLSNVLSQIKGCFLTGSHNTKKKLEEMTELERLQAENAVLK